LFSLKLQIFTDSRYITSDAHLPRMQGSARQTPISFCAVANGNGTHYGTNPNPAKNRYTRNENLNRFRFSAYRIRKRRRIGLADAEGLRGNEA